MSTARLSRAALTIVLILAGAWIIMEGVLLIDPRSPNHQVPAFDYETYMAAARDWLGGHGFYHAYQLAGPYVVVSREVMYPPTLLWVLVPFTVLPAALWFAVPTLVTGAIIVGFRPSLAGWTLVVLCLAWPWTMNAWLNGNPVIWATAAVAVGLRWPAASVWVLLKPTFAPLALLGVRQRGWWAGALAFGVASLVLAPLWLDYLRALANAQWPGSGPLYSLIQLPALLAPVAARYFGTGIPRSTAKGASVTTMSR